MAHHDEFHTDASVLHAFVQQLSLRRPLMDIQGFKKWFRDTNICQQALLWLVIEVVPKVLERIECPKNPCRPHVVQLVQDDNSVKLTKLIRGRCECSSTIFELCPEASRQVIEAHLAWNDTYDELQRFLENC
ncbi:hypothetical protein PQX77_002498 [Marasmius sp. AFHP31]|nr:hypothetical protein PQX77_002498 [Marasmius sp. AFHP31]